MKYIDQNQNTNESSHHSEIVFEVIRGYACHSTQIRQLKAQRRKLSPETYLVWLFHWKPYLQKRGLLWAFALTYEEFCLWLLVHQKWCLKLIKRWCSDFDKSECEAVYMMLFEKYDETSYHKFIWLNKQRLFTCLRWVKEDYRRKFKREYVSDDVEKLKVKEWRYFTLKDRSQRQEAAFNALEICTHIKEYYKIKDNSRMGFLIRITREQADLPKPRFIYELLSEEEKTAFLPKGFKGDLNKRKEKINKEISRSRGKLLELLDEYRKQSPEIEMHRYGKN